jgi:hypothetical protein
MSPLASVTLEEHIPELAEEAFKQAYWSALTL